MGKKSGSKRGTGRSKRKKKASQLLRKSLVLVFLFENPDLKSMWQV